MEAEMEEALKAGKDERTESRVGYRSGYMRSSDPEVSQEAE
jgi:transposase-like protein